MKWLFFKTLGTALSLLGLVVIFITSALVNHSRYLLVFQNTDEVRATGGFIGSYAVLDFGAREPLRFEIRDMYDPSGIGMTLPSPPGQKEYLSEGKGLKLIDANWSPDFPTSAQTILSYFANLPGDPQDFDGVIAVPLSTVEKLVALIGEIYLPDSQKNISGENLAAFLRADRAQFFPGSQDKAQALQASYTALRLKVGQLNGDDWRRIAQAIIDQKLWQDIQIYSLEPRVQHKVEKLNLEGGLQAYGPDDIFLMPVESNVGINKANRKVTRLLSVDLVGQELVMTIQFHNAFTIAERPLNVKSALAVAPHLAYVNYYRVITRTDMTLANIQVDGQSVDQWDENEITASNGLTYKQIGFLVVVPEESSVETIVKFTLPELNRPQLLLQRQIGVEYAAIESSIE
jgi:hypothetical protein